MSEQFAFDQFTRDRCHVDGHERTCPPLAMVVQHAGDEFLAGPALTRDHDGQFGLRQTGQRTVDILHRRRTADQRQVFAVCRFGTALRLTAG